MFHNRSSLRALAEIRLVDAKTLLDAGRYDASYYLAGYVIELGLKACIARQTRAEEFPDKTRAERAWKHSPLDLVRAAGLERELNDRISSNAEFAALWAVAKDWQETSRYERHAEQEARDIFDAVSQEPNGVLAWIRAHW